MFLAFWLVGYYVADPSYSTFLSSLDKVDGSLVLSMYTGMTIPGSVICNVIVYIDFPTTVHKPDILRGPLRRVQTGTALLNGEKINVRILGLSRNGLGRLDEGR